MPEIDELEARLLLASQYCQLAEERNDELFNAPLYFDAFKQLEYVAKVDSRRGLGLFHDPFRRAKLRNYDIGYTIVVDIIRETDGVESAIDYLEKKMSIFAHVPGEPMISILNQLGSLYFNELQDKRKARRCFQKVLESEPTPIPEYEEYYQSAQLMARKNLAIVDR